MAATPQPPLGTSFLHLFIALANVPSQDRFFHDTHALGRGSLTAVHKHGTRRPSSTSTSTAPTSGPSVGTFLFVYTFNDATPPGDNWIFLCVCTKVRPSARLQ